MWDWVDFILGNQWNGIKELTCVARVDLKVVLSYTHPFWHGTVGRSAMLEVLNSRWYWGSVNILQEFGVPSCLTGILTMSLSSRDKLLKTPPSSRELMSQWWGGIAAMKIFSRKLNGKVSRGITNKATVLSWNLPKPLTSARTFSNFILRINEAACENDQRYRKAHEKTVWKWAARFFLSLLLVDNQLVCDNVLGFSIK